MLMVAMLFIFSLFTAQIIRVQGVDAAAVSAKARDSRLHHENVPALRGQIVDDKGAALATSVQRYNVTADATQTSQYKSFVDGRTTVLGNSGVAAGLASVLGGSAKQYYATLQAATQRKSRFVYLVKNVTPEQWQRVLALKLGGIYPESTQTRQYPQGASASSIVGWVDAGSSAGAGGVELMKQGILNGRPGVRTYEEAPDGTVIATGSNSDTPAVNGSNVKLTLDSDIQYYASNALAAGVKKTRAEAGDLVVMDRQGNVLAAASYPSFDPTNPGAASPGNLQPRGFAETYEPGSTSKIITMAAALSAGVATPTSQVIVPSQLRRGGALFHDSEPHGTESLTVAGVLAESSNMGTMLTGSKVSSDYLYGFMRKFGLGAPTGVGFPGETGGIVAPPSQWSGSQKYTVMFGQGLSTTLMQQASVYQTVANDGVRLPVNLIAGVQNASGGWTKPADSRKPVRVISTGVASQLRTMLSGVVGQDGTAQKAKVAGYNVAGKTGTAELYDAKLGRYNGYTASFIGMAPAENPQYIVAVALQNPKTTIYGGEAAAPIFSQVAGYVLRTRGVAPSRKPVSLYPIQYAAVSTEQRPR
ncbi:penicillin-binding protein 2 [Allobranchiibius sp. GilTou38]|uniref:peptidoglycan D,D-transpeptidase FtsI family protein n=1 Tax=Allobranchiibius sp. GilTou38 TaxID=2815210 RepID=UPI001AA0F9E5|nr:penicillin-binding protein 2 [Allobranchiibius sp. GilTou38]MBO1766951.1 penicillin-binding protein 2 [Allobranchiibius sp. GilTou38]